MTFSGKTTVSGNFKVTNNWGNGYVAAFKDVEVVADASLPNNHITLGGEVTVDAGKTLTIPASATIGNSASFVLGGALATLIDNTQTLTAEKVSAAQGYSLYRDGATTWKILNSVKTWAPPEGYSNWGTADNWSPSGVPTENDLVVFDGNTTVNIDNSARNCGPIKINNNANVVIVGSSSGAEIRLNGDISGNGTLTFRGSGPKRVSGSGNIASTVAVVFENGANNGPWLSFGFAVNGPVSLGDKLASWDAQNTINGTTTFRESTFATSGGNNNLVFGPIHVENDLAINKGGPKVILNGAVTIDGRKTLTVDTSDTGKVQIGDGATFVLSGVGATLVDNGGNIDGSKVTTPIVKGAKISITTDGSKKTYKLSLVGMTIILR